jgi:hypothetical protein
VQHHTYCGVCTLGACSSSNNDDTLSGCMPAEARLQGGAK